MGLSSQVGKNLCGVSNNRGTAWKARMQWGNLEPFQKPAAFFWCFLKPFQGFQKFTLCCQDLICLIVSVLKLQKWWKSLWFCLWCPSVSRNHYVTDTRTTWFLWPPRHQPWRSICRRTKSRGRLEVLDEDGRNGVMNWYELIWIVLPLHGSPPQKIYSFEIKLMSLVYGQWWDGQSHGRACPLWLLTRLQMLRCRSCQVGVRNAQQAAVFLDRYCNSVNIKWVS